MFIVKIRFLSLIAFFLFISSSCSQAEKIENSKAAVTLGDADNTAHNIADAVGIAKTPLDQGEGKVDLEISANIRKSILADKSLSLNAHNVKIITSNGT